MYNDTDIKKIRKNLRQSMPKGEKMLWQKLRRKNLGYTFKRQYSIQRFVVDFYCAELRLAIEIDGITHEIPERAKKYKEKEQLLEKLDIQLERFTSDQVAESLDNVVETIFFICKKRRDNTAP